MALSADSRLGPYEIASAIGAGGMGQVYKAVDTRLSRTVALKVLPPHFADDPDMKQQLRAGSADDCRSESPEHLHAARCR
ncbi:MAG TPA: hypothetical protein VES67_01670 [Vicinamibacterales bacterium]|nr:hypothetical protein [Vicinamibacterales bacterium]